MDHPDQARHWPQITMYTTPWCGDCHRSRRFLESRSIPYAEVDIEQDAEAARYVVEVNGGYRSVPTILIEGVGALTEPSDRELAAALQINRPPAR